MTAIIASIIGNQAVVAADSRIASDSKIIKTSAKFSKILQTKHFIAGVSGFNRTLDIVAEILSDEKYLRKKRCKMRDSEDVIAFADDVYDKLAEHLEAFPDIEKDETHSELLILTRTSIYQVDPYRTVTESDTFAAIGNGEQLAIGAMTILYPLVLDGQMDLSRATYKAVEAAILNNTTCGHPIHVKALE